MDNNTWGAELNALLEVTLNEDGTPNNAALALILGALVAGTNITIDTTTPYAPVINATGSTPTLSLHYNGNGPLPCQVIDGLAWNAGNGGLVYIVMPAALTSLGEDVPAFAYVDNLSTIEWFSYLSAGSIVGFDGAGHQIGMGLTSANGNATVENDGSFVIDSGSYNWVFSATENSVQLPVGHKLWFANLISDLVGSGTDGDWAFLTGDSSPPIFAVLYGGEWTQYAPPTPGAPIIRAFPFDHTTDQTSFYTPQSGEILLNAWIEIEGAWDGTTPTADLFMSDSAVGWFGTLGWPVNASIADSDSNFTQLLSNMMTNASLDLATAQAYSTTSGSSAPPMRFVPAKFNGTDSVEIVVSLDGKKTTNGGLQAPTPPTLPLVITPGVNDTFILNCTFDSSSPETFTIPPGTYTTVADVATAMEAATGTVTSTFLVYFGALDNGGVVGIFEQNGSSLNATDTLVEGNGGLAALGFTDNPTHIVGGAGGNPGSTIGNGYVYLVTSVPTV